MPIWNLTHFIDPQWNAGRFELTLDGRFVLLTAGDDDRAVDSIAEALGENADLALWAANIALKVGELSFGRK